MTQGERRAYEHLHERVTRLACQLQLLLSDCRDGDQRIIADETQVRRGIQSGMHALCEWTGQSGFRESAAG